MFPGWRERDRRCPVDQVANARDALVDLTAVSQARAEATRAGWAPLTSGQAIPLIGERVVEDVEPCYDV